MSNLPNGSTSGKGGQPLTSTQKLIAELPSIIKRYKQEFELAKSYGMSSEKGKIHYKNSEKLKLLLLDCQKQDPESFQAILNRSANNSSANTNTNTNTNTNANLQANNNNNNNTTITSTSTSTNRIVNSNDTGNGTSSGNGSGNSNFDASSDAGSANFGIDEINSVLHKEVEKYQLLKSSFTSDNEKINKLKNALQQISSPSDRIKLQVSINEFDKKIEAMKRQLIEHSRNIKHYHDLKVKFERNAKPGANVNSAAASPSSNLGSNYSSRNNSTGSFSSANFALSNNNGASPANSSSTPQNVSTSRNAAAAPKPLATRASTMPTISGNTGSQAGTPVSIPTPNSNLGSNTGIHSTSQVPVGPHEINTSKLPLTKPAGSQPPMIYPNFDPRTIESRFFTPYNEAQPIFSRPNLISYLKQIMYEEPLLLGKPSNGKVIIDADVENLINELLKEFLDSVIGFSSRLARHRNDTSVRIEDFKLNLERNWGIFVNGIEDSSNLSTSEQFRKARKRTYTPTENYISKLRKVYANNVPGNNGTTSGTGDAHKAAQNTTSKNNDDDDDDDDDDSK